MEAESNYYVITCEEEQYNLLFHQRTSKIAKIDKAITAEVLDKKALEEKIGSYKDKNTQKKREYGKGRITMTFMSSRTCNLGCTYCFAGEGEYGNTCNKPKYFTYELYMKALKKGLEMYPEGIKRIGFFGGEPLLNLSELIKFVPECIKVFQNKQLPLPTFAMTTNAILIDEAMAEFFKSYGMRICVSLDGEKAINDKVRVFKNHKRSVYDQVMKNCELLERYGVNYTVQATLNAHHINNYKTGDAIAWVEALEKLNYITASIVPVETNVEELKIQSVEQLQNLELFTRELTNYYLDKMVKGEFSKIASFLVLPMIQLARNEYVASCSSGQSFFWDTDGSAYSCHMFCNESVFKLGDIEEGIQVARAEKIANMNRKEGEACSKCIAGDVCSVWCKGIQYLYNGDMHQICKPRCVFQRAIVEECIKRLVKLGTDRKKGQGFWGNYKLYGEYLQAVGFDEKILG